MTSHRGAAGGEGCSVADIPPDDDVEEIDISELLPPAELDPFGDDVPTVVDRLRCLCPGCGDEQMHLDDSVQPPSSRDEAWRRGCCYGNSKFFWCVGPFDRRGIGQLTMIGSMEVFFFPDRRLVNRQVAVERRRK